MSTRQSSSLVSQDDGQRGKADAVPKVPAHCGIEVDEALTDRPEFFNKQRLQRVQGRWWKWLALTVGWLGLLIVVMIVLQAFDPHLIEQAAHWQPWVQRHAAVFLVWRLMLYGGIAYGWWRLRRRLFQQPTIPPDTRKRLRRTQWAAVLALLLLEGSLLLGQSSWGAQP